MKFVAVIVGPLSELEQAEERLRRMSRAKRLRILIAGKDHGLSNQGFSGEITVLSIVDSYRLLVKFFQSV
jgi:hypothetical protein